MLKQFNKFVVSDGRGIRFWKDTWCGTEPLSETFHNICSMANTKDAYLADLWEWSREGRDGIQFFCGLLMTRRLTICLISWPQSKLRDYF